MSSAAAQSFSPRAPLRVSVLDQTPVAEGTTSAAALRNSIDLARRAEALGYHRYWVAEHHGSPMIAGPSPEVLIAAIASATSRMRIGSGGVMLPHYSALKVAENFSVLAGLFPESHRSRARSRRRHGSRDRVRACSATGASARPTTFRSNSRSCSDISTTASSAIIPFADSRRCFPAFPSARSRGCSALRIRAQSGPPSSGCRTLSRISSIRRAPRSPRSIAISSCRRPSSRSHA